MPVTYRSALSYEPPLANKGHSFGMDDDGVWHPCSGCGVPFSLLWHGAALVPGFREKDPPRLVRVLMDDSWCPGAVLALPHVDADTHQPQDREDDQDHDEHPREATGR